MRRRRRRRSETAQCRATLGEPTLTETDHMEQPVDPSERRPQPTMGQRVRPEVLNLGSWASSLTETPSLNLNNCQHQPSERQGARHRQFTPRRHLTHQATAMNPLHTSPLLLPTITIIIYSILILLPETNLAHSNINSVWLSKEDAPIDPSKLSLTGVNRPHRANGPQQSNAATATISERSGDSWPATSGSRSSAVRGLQASSSSLQPTIAVLESINHDNSIGERRMDSAADGLDRVRPTHFNSSSSAAPYGSFSNEASSLNHLWSLNQTNAQVQFDEEHLAAAGGSSGSAKTSPSSNPINRSTDNRRQDNETSTLSPQHDVPAVPPTTTEENLQQLNNGVDLATLDDRQGQADKQSASKTTTSQHYLSGSLSGVHEPESEPKRDMVAVNASLPDSSNNRSFVYYPLEGNKWNPPNTNQVAASTEPGSNQQERQPVDPSMSAARRKLHNSGTQYNLRDLEWALKSHAAALYKQQQQDHSSNGRRDLAGYQDNTRTFVSGYNRVRDNQLTGNGYQLLEDLNRNNNPGYYYGGSAGQDRVHFNSNQRSGSSSSSYGHQQSNVAANDGHRWRTDAQNLHYGFLPAQTSEPPHLLTRTTPLPAVYNSHALTTTTLLPGVYSTTTLRPFGDSYQTLHNNLNPGSGGQRLAQAPLRPRTVTHPARRRPANPHHHRPAASGGGQLLVDNRRDHTGRWRQRPPSNRNKHLASASELSHQRVSFVQGTGGGFPPSPAYPYGPYGNHRFTSVHHPQVPRAKGAGASAGSAQSKAKKSILGTLGSKLNSWVDPSGAREQKLEESFYETGSHQHRRRIRPPAHWNPNLYYIHAPQAALASVLDPTHALGSTSYLAATAPLGGQLHHHPTRLSADQNRLLHSAALNYYPGSYVPVSSHLSPTLAIQQPTVAPAPSSLDKFYSPSGAFGGHHQPSGHHYESQRLRPKFPLRSLESHLGQSSSHLSQYMPQRNAGAGLGQESGPGQQQPANFIPVVAVSVTKTSPAPRPAANNNIDQLDDASLEQELNSELMDYLELKTGEGHSSRSRNRLHSRGAPPPASSSSSYRDSNSGGDINMVRAQLDDYGNLASGSMSRDSAFQQQQQHQRHQQPATFAGAQANGSDPKQEHTTTVKSAIFGYLPHEADKPLLQAINMLPHYNTRLSRPGGGDAYVGQLSEHNPPPPHLLNHHLPRAHDGSDLVASLDEPPSLELQLQANNFAQNDIAHPFADSAAVAAAAAAAAHQSQQRKSAYSAGGLQSLLSQRELHAAATKLRSPIDEVYPASQHQYHGFQFLQPAESGFVSAHQQQQLNPLLTAGDQHHAHHQAAHQPAILTAAATELQSILPAAVMFAASPAYALQPAALAAADGGPADHQQAASGGGGGDDDDDGSSALNKGKKRSGDFFASAGQLLLSALPLLLAPTLGLMFASSPQLPVARYQAPNTFSGGSNSMQSSIPGEYLNSLNIDGHVSNASPVPQVFTPSPPGYNQTLNSQRAPPSAKQSAGPNRVAAAASNQVTSIRNKPTPIPQKLTVTLTTLGPPVFVNETETHSAEAEQQPKAPPVTQTIDHHHHHHHVGNTILLLADDSGADGDSLNGTIDYKISPLNHTHTETVGGYEGADYDAQFANLRKHAQPGQQHQPGENSSSHQDIYQLDTRAHNRTPTGAPPGERGPSGSPHRHVHASSSAYSGSEPAPEGSPHLEPQQPATKPASARPEEDDISTKLYPVSTWPPMRRRTVSLVTSNGNKTLLDASEKYQNLDYYTSQQVAYRAPLATINYTTATTTFDDSIDEPEMGYLNSSSSSLPARSQVGRLNEGGRDALDFMFSDGLSTVSLSREPFASRLSKSAHQQPARPTNRTARLKRAANKTEASSAQALVRQTTSRLILIDGRPVRVVKRVIRPRAAAAAAAATTTATMSPAAANESQVLRETPEQKPPVAAAATTNSVAHASANGSLAESASSLSLAPRPFEEAESSPNAIEPLKIDDSRSKSAHIVATMIARLEDEEEAIGGHQASSSNDYVTQRLGGAPSDADELKELLLRKKALLARLTQRHGNRTRQAATEFSRQLPPDQPHVLASPSNMDESTETTRQHQMGDDQLPAPGSPEDRRFSAGGRGRIPHSEVAPVIKIKLYSNGTVRSRARLGPPVIRNPDRLELSEETKEALANFGSLMMKDSVQMQRRNPGRHEKQAKRLRNEPFPRPPPPDNRWEDGLPANQRPRPFHEPTFETPLEGVATERSISRLAGGGFMPEGPPSLHPDEGYNNFRYDSDELRMLRKKGGSEFGPEGQGGEAPLRRRPGRGDDQYYYQYQADEARPTRAPTHQQLQMAERVSLFDSDPFPANEDKGFSPSEEYPNGHGHARSHHPSEAADHQRLVNNTDRYSSHHHHHHHQANRSSFFNDDFRSPSLRGQEGSHSAANDTDRRSESSSPGPAQYSAQANRRDITLQQPGGYVYDMRNYPPDPLPGGYSPHLPDLQPPYRPPLYNGTPSTTYAPSNPYAAASYPHLNPIPKPQYQQQQQYNQPADDNYPPPVPNGYGSRQPPEYLGQGPSSAGFYQPSSGVQHQQNKYNVAPPDLRYPASSDNYQREIYTAPNRPQQFAPARGYQMEPSSYAQHPRAAMVQQGGPLAISSSQERGDSKSVNDYLKRVQFSDSDRDKLMASYLTCDGLLNDNDHCLERLSCEFSDPQNIERANKLDRAVSSILLGHILINTYIPNQFKLRLKSASLFGYTQSGKCSRFVCNKLARPGSSIRA